MSDSSLRIDKWLWYARFFKTRSIASAVCAAGQVRAGGDTISKAHHKVRPGDVLTFPQGRHIRIVKILALAGRRGPAPEAQALYEDLSPPCPASQLPRDLAGMAGPPQRLAGSGRPTKRDRRRLEKLHGSEP